MKSIKKLLFIPFCLVSLLACTPKPQLASEPTDQKSIGMYSQNIKRGYAELQRRNDPDIAEVSTLLDQLNSDSENKTFFSNINQIRQSAGAQAQ